MVGIYGEGYQFLSIVAIRCFLYSVTLILIFEPLKENIINYDNNSENNNNKNDDCS